MRYVNPYTIQGWRKLRSAWKYLWKNYCDNGAMPHHREAIELLRDAMTEVLKDAMDQDD